MTLAPEVPNHDIEMRESFRNGTIDIKTIRQGHASCILCKYYLPFTDLRDEVNDIEKEWQCTCEFERRELWKYEAWACNKFVLDDNWEYALRNRDSTLKTEPIVQAIDFAEFEELRKQCDAHKVSAPDNEGRILCALCDHAEKSRIYPLKRMYSDFKVYCGCEGHEHGGEHWDSYAWWKCTGYVPKVKND